MDLAKWDIYNWVERASRTAEIREMEKNLNEINKIRYLLEKRISKRRGGYTNAI
ncbi:hypothetical protein [Cytobacillus gottheilii]|uniref:hypothetical protein n=1 Tax=Cytobacillus gottheilii TaxID=859144 RepID=UPI00159443D2|nr:hypothetical protein [Cytobacillus gottheilii]